MARFTGGKNVEFDMFDGSKKTLKIDVVQYATGFKFNFPFLDPSDDIVRVEEEESKGCYIEPMYKLLWSINHPEFSVINVL